ncbi:unnamed protein product [Gongylonema pulchrum]|uniref:Secreted protein n=1 Tax=Gongylonema pulchrum TaxID=637853 RepID=A0A183EHI1_9BILA|nr:unnamed protein product [Gongylonema pulchrum]
MGLWQESFFGRVALEQQAQLFVVLIFGILKETLPKMRFNSEMFWFGGEQKRLKTDPLNNSLSFLSACWHIAALALRSSGNRL